MHQSIDVKCVLTGEDNSLKQLSLSDGGWPETDKCFPGMCNRSKGDFSASCIFIYPVVRMRVTSHKLHSAVCCFNLLCYK
jgi:hypothetical protein